MTKDLLQAASPEPAPAASDTETKEKRNSSCSYTSSSMPTDQGDAGPSSFVLPEPAILEQPNHPSTSLVPNQEDSKGKERISYFGDDERSDSSNDSGEITIQKKISSTPSLPASTASGRSNDVTVQKKISSTPSLPASTTANDNNSGSGSGSAFFTGSAATERARQRKAEISAAAAAVVAAAKAAKAAAPPPASPLLAPKKASPLAAVQQPKTKEENRETEKSVASQAREQDDTTTTTGSGTLSDKKYKDTEYSSFWSFPSIKSSTRTELDPEPVDKNEDTADRKSQGSQGNAREPRTFSPQESPERDEEAKELHERRLRKRYNALFELLKTEFTYLHDLEILEKHFFVAIRQFTMISRDQKDQLARNIHAIYVFQLEFFEALFHAIDIVHDPDMRDKDLLGRVADCIVRWAPRFVLYLDYCTHQDVAARLHKELMVKNEPYAKLIENLNSELRTSFDFRPPLPEHAYEHLADGSLRPEDNRLQFTDYLITPVQRIFRYKLLLDAIHKTTPCGSAEHKLLANAIAKMNQVASDLNVAKAKMEAERKTNLFLNRLDTEWVISERFYGLLGCVLLLGTLDFRILDHHENKAKRYGCALFNSYIIIAKAKRQDKYEARHWFPIRMFETIRLGDETNIGYSWLLENKELVLEFTALSDLERTIWMTAMEDIRDQSRKEYDRRLAEGKIGSEVEEIFGCAFYRPSHSGGGPFCSVFSRGSSLRSNASRSQPNSAREEGSMDFPHRELVDASDVKRRSIIEEEESSSARSSCSNITSAGAPSSQGSMLEFRQLFNDYQSHRKYNQYNLRCEVFDSKFEDICSTPILQVRAQARQNREAGWQEWKRRSRLAKSASMVSFSSASPLSAPFSPCPRTFNRSAGPSRSNSKGKQSYPRQQQPAAAAAADISPSIRRKTSMPSRLRQQAGPITSASPQPSPSSSSSSSRPRIPAPPPMSRRPLPTAGSVYKESMMSKLSYPASSVEERPPTNQGRNTKPTSSENSMQRSFSLATMGIARSSSRLLGRFVEKINSISTPGRARRASKTESINSDRFATSSPGRARCASRTESLSSDKAPTSSPGRTVNNSTETVNSDHGSTTSVGRKPNRREKAKDLPPLKIPSASSLHDNIRSSSKDRSLSRISTSER